MFSTAPLRLRRLQLLCVAIVMTATRVPAQTIGVNVGDSARLIVAPGARITVPLQIDLASAGTSLNLAALSGSFTWSASRLTLDSVRSANADFSHATSLTNAASGSIITSVYSATRLATSGPLLNLFFTASATAGGTRLTFTPTDAGNETGVRVLNSLRLRQANVCVAAMVRWGDVNNDGSVSIIDAQQIARYSVGLSVANLSAVTTRGDVTADNSVSIIDAQQIARFSVGLSAAVRINTLLSAEPTTASLAVSPSSPQSLVVGATVDLLATPRDASSIDLTGCATVTWSSSAPSVAAVSSTGVVTAVSPGTAMITATSSSVTTSVSFTVSGSSGATGITLTATSPIPTSRFYVRVDSGGLAAEINRRIVSTGRSLTQSFALPPGSGYRVRVYAIDSASSAPDSMPLVGALALARNVNVTANSMTMVAPTLSIPGVTVTVPDTVSAVQQALANVTLRYPVRAFRYSATSDVYCHLRWGSSAITDMWSPSSWYASTSALSDTTASCQSQIPAQGVSTTLSHQLQVYLGAFVADSSYTIYPRLVVPSTQRGQALRQLVIRPVTTGVTIAFTSSVPARRVYAIAMGGALGTPSAPDSIAGTRLRAAIQNDMMRPPVAAPTMGTSGGTSAGTAGYDLINAGPAAAVGVGEVIVRLDGNGLRSGSLTVPLPPGAGYDVRLVSIDSSSWANDSTNWWSWVLGSSGRVTGVTVPSVGLGSASAVLTAPTVSVTWPDSVGVGQAITGSITVSDPADIYQGLTTGFAQTWYGVTPWKRNSGSSQRTSSQYTSTVISAGSRTWTMTLPAQTVSGALFVQSSAGSFFWQPDSRVAFLDVYDRNLARGEALRAVKIGAWCAPVPITLGDSVARLLTAYDCPSQRQTGSFEDRYTLTVAAATQVRIQMQSGDVDTYLQVRNSTGTVIAENDDVDYVSTNSALIVSLAAGSYTIHAGSFSAGETGNYTLTVRPRNSLALTTTAGARVAMLEPNAAVTTVATVANGTGATVSGATVSYLVRDDSVASVSTTGTVTARARSGATPGAFVVATGTSVFPQPSDSIWVLVPRNTTGPVLRTDLSTYLLPQTVGTPVTFNVLIDMRNANQLGAADFDLVFPTTHFYSPSVTAAAGVVAQAQPVNGSIGRISFSYARPTLGTAGNDGLIQIGQVTLYSRGTSSSSTESIITLTPWSLMSSSLTNLTGQSTAYSYPIILRTP